MQNLDIVSIVTCTVKKSNPKVPTAIKKRIIIYATKNFAKNGYAKTSLDAIAKSANVSKGGIYHHYPSKEELFTAVLFQSVAVSEDANSELFQNKQDIVRDLNKHYDKIIDGPLDLSRIWIEGISESIHNTKLRNLLNHARKETVKIAIARLKKIRTSMGAYQGFTDSELAELAELILDIYRGMMIERIMGSDPKKIRKRWINAMQIVTSLKK